MILSQEHEEGGTAIHARVGEHLAARLEPFLR
jgi:GTPase